jgi:uncharacterized protein involved in cysteine biosynthesis
MPALPSSTFVSLPAALLLAVRQLTDPHILRILGKSLAITLLLFAVLAGCGWMLLDWGLERAGLGDAWFTGAGGVRQVAAFVLAMLGLWLGWRIVAMAVIQFFADEVVLAVEARHYPHAASAARELPLREQLAGSLKAAGRALSVNLLVLPVALALLVTGVGTALLFWLVNAVLLGRELQDMVWLRHRRSALHQAPIGRAERFLLGGCVAALLALPFVNLLAPVLGAAAATHLIHRKPFA